MSYYELAEANTVKALRIMELEARLAEADALLCRLRNETFTRDEMTVSIDAYFTSGHESGQIGLIPTDSAAAKEDKHE